MFWRFVLVALVALSSGCSGGSTADRTQGSDASSVTSATLVLQTPAKRPQVQGFAGQPDRGNLVVYPAAAARLDGAYTWHRSDFSEAHAIAAIGSGRLRVNTPAGETLDFQYQRHVEHPNGDWTWIGHLQDGAPGQETILTFGDKAVFGTIAQPAREPLKLTIRNGVSWLVETDRAKLAGIVNGATRPRNPDYFVPPKLSGRSAADAPVLTAQGVQASAAAAVGSTGTVVDLVLGYTTGFAAGLGGQSQAATRLNFLVDVTNQAYVNAQVDAQLRLVRTVQVSYPDATPNGTALEELTGFRAPSTPTTPAAAFAELRAARDQYGADVVSLVRKFHRPENDGCGIAWLIGGGQSAIVQSDEFFGYSVVSDGTAAGSDGMTYFCREETLAHELGHNMGSAHDRDAADGDDNILQANEYGNFPYSFGYKTGAGAGNFYTVMAYGESGQTRYRTFSNPRTTYCGGFVCGAVNADNARSLSLTIPVVATFRTQAVQPVLRRARHDIDGDGKSDLLLQHAPNGWFAYWTMNGAAVTRYSNAFTRPAGSVQAVSGDFNGDSRLDIVWTRTSDRSLTGWFGDGNGFVQAPIRDYAQGWRVVLAGDVDGDGKSDLVLEHPGNRQLAYWTMNGATPARYSVAFTQPAGFRLETTGDYNGDGKLDLIWLRRTDRALLMWVGDGNGFTAMSMNPLSAGVSVLASGDANGDGRDDLLVSNNARRQLRILTLDGPVVTSGSQFLETPIGHMFVASGDHDGDGKLDLVWERSSDRSLLLWRGTGSSFQSAPIRDHAPGWQMKHIEQPVRYTKDDVDAEGGSDLLLYAPIGQSLSYMTMQGSTLYGFSPKAYAANGSAVASGDFNADGHHDVVLWRAGQGHLVLWEGGSDDFVETRLPTPSVGWIVSGAGDVDGDGRSDLLLENEGFNAIAYWIMDGAGVSRYSSAYARPSGYAMAARGDFNGDGRLDIAWSRASDRSLLLWQGNGIGFEQSVIGNYASGWVIAGAGDIDGDERSDLILTGSGSAAYWIMQGNIPIRYSPGFIAPTGYRLGAIGDYNGDGRTDLAWDRVTDGAVTMWIGDGNGFNVAYAGVHNPGYGIIQP